MFDVMKPAPFLGQIPLSYNFNALSPGVINYGYGQTPIVNPGYGAAPRSYQGAGGGGGGAMATGDQCFSCTNPDTGDNQYGVTADVAANLRSQGYRCRPDQCANRGLSMPTTFPSEASLPAAPPEFGDYGQAFGMMGARVPLAKGLGRRALL